MNRPLLVLDLDMTLIYCNDKPYREAVHSTPHGEVVVRDGVDDFLESQSANYDLMIWSANGVPYIKDMLDIFWPKHLKLIDIFDQSHTIIKGENGLGIPFYKDIKRVAKKHPNYPIERIVGVDDKPAVYSKCFGNLVAVSPFTGQPDTVLSRLGDYLTELSKKPNFREVEKRYWNKSPVKANPEVDSSM